MVRSTQVRWPAARVYKTDRLLASRAVIRRDHGPIPLKRLCRALLAGKLAASV
jgi:hypothetical protein